MKQYFNDQVKDFRDYIKHAPMATFSAFAYIFGGTGLATGASVWPALPLIAILFGWMFKFIADAKVQEGRKTKYCMACQHYHDPERRG